MGILKRLFGSGKGNNPRVLPRPGVLGTPQPPGVIQPVGAGDVEKFLYWQEKVYVTSTDVAWGQYNISGRELTLGYLDGTVYVYYDVSEAEATSFITSSSKGGWVWDHLRVRGTKDSYKKEYVKIG